MSKWKRGLTAWLLVVSLVSMSILIAGFHPSAANTSVKCTLTSLGASPNVVVQCYNAEGAEINPSDIQVAEIVSGVVTVVVDNVQEIEVPGPTATVTETVTETPTPAPTVTLPPLPGPTVTISPRPQPTITIPGPTATITKILPPIIEFERTIIPGPTRTVFVPGPTRTVTGPVVTETATPFPLPAKTVTATATETITERAVPTRQPPPRRDTMDDDRFFRFDIDLGDRSLSAGELGIGLLTLLALVAVVLMAMYGGYVLGYKDQEQQDTDFIRALLDRSKPRRGLHE